MSIKHITKILAAIAAIFEFRIFLTDDIQAYLESTAKLDRDKFIEPRKELNLNPDELIFLPNCSINFSKDLIVEVKHSEFI